MKTIVVGCGRVGSALATRLSQVGHTVTVIDPDREAFERRGRDFTGRVLDGLGFDKETLERAGINDCDALAAVTSDDASNVIIARIARDRYHVERVVARQYEQKRAILYQLLGIQTASTVNWVVDRLEQLLSAPDLGTALVLGSGGVEVLDLYIPPDLAGRPLSSLHRAGESQVIALTRGGLTTLPTEDLLLQAGDLVHLAAARGAKTEIAQLVVRKAGA
jgi:trk system potassium uptake protein TrkA